MQRCWHIRHLVIPHVQPDDYRVDIVIQHLLEAFEPHEYDALVVLNLKKKEISAEVRNVINASGIWKNINLVTEEHQREQGLQSWKALQVSTALLHRPQGAGHRLSARKLEDMTGLREHMFAKTVDNVLKEERKPDRSATRNPKLVLVIIGLDRTCI